MLAFLEKQKAPLYKLVPPADGNLLTISVSPDVSDHSEVFKET